MLEDRFPSDPVYPELAYQIVGEPDLKGGLRCPHSLTRSAEDCPCSSELALDRLVHPVTVGVEPTQDGHNPDDRDRGKHDRHRGLLDTPLSSHPVDGTAISQPKARVTSPPVGLVMTGMSMARHQPVGTAEAAGDDATVVPAGVACEEPASYPCA